MSGQRYRISDIKRTHWDTWENNTKCIQMQPWGIFEICNAHTVFDLCLQIFAGGGPSVSVRQLQRDSRGDKHNQQSMKMQDGQYRYWQGTLRLLKDRKKPKKLPGNRLHVMQCDYTCYWNTRERINFKTSQEKWQETNEKNPNFSFYQALKSQGRKKTLSRFYKTFLCLVSLNMQPPILFFW